MKDLSERALEFSCPYRVAKGKGFCPRDVKGVEQLAESQDMLYAQDRRSLPLIFQALDAAGEDGTIDHVMSGVNPQGVQAYSFQAPSPEGLAAARREPAGSGR